MVNSYAAITQISPATPSIQTNDVFNLAFTSNSLSPIDEFIENTNGLNVLYLGLVDPINIYLSTFVLLG